MKEFFINHKKYSLLVFCEIIIIFAVLLGVFGKSCDYHLNADNLVIRDDKVIIDDYTNVEATYLNENTFALYDNKSHLEEDAKSLYITGRNDEETYGRWIAGSEPLSLRPGTYEIEVRYLGLVNNNDIAANSDDISGCIQINSESDDYLIRYKDIPLANGRTINNGRLWIRSLKEINDIQFMISFYGVGDLRIDSIVIKEYVAWRYLKLFIWIIAFIVLDVIVYNVLINEKITTKDRLVFIGIVSIIVFVNLPLYADFLFHGHDIDFHITRLEALADAIQNGQWIETIQFEMVNGYGYATPLFYGQIFFYIPAILYNLGMPLQMCFQVYEIMINIGTVLISYFCFKCISKEKYIALLGALIYTLSSYRIVNMFLRAACGEYTAMMFYPLVVYGFIAIYRKEVAEISIKDCIMIVLGLTGVIQSHILSCEMIAIFIIILCVLKIKRTFEPGRFIMLASTAVATALLNLGFLVPFLNSMSMNVRINTNELENIQEMGTYLIQVFGVFMTASGLSEVGTANEMPMALGIALVLALIIFIYCYIKRTAWGNYGDIRIEIGAINFAFCVISIILSTEFFPWDSIKEFSVPLAKILCAVQFPWRYLSVATVFATFTLIMALDMINDYAKETILKYCYIVLTVLSIIPIGMFFTEFMNTAIEHQILGGADVVRDISGAEYMLDSSIEGYMRWRSAIADFEKVGISGYTSDHGKISFNCSNISDENQIIQIPNLAYDNYHAYTQDAEELNITKGDNNRMAINIPAQYNGKVNVNYEIPLLWKISYIISIMMFIALLLFGLYDKGMLGKFKRGNK